LWGHLLHHSGCDSCLKKELQNARPQTPVVILSRDWNECQLFKNLTDQLKLILLSFPLISRLNVREEKEFILLYP